MKGQISSNAHSVLQYLISRAALEGKTGTTIVQIPITDLFTEFEGVDFEPEAAGLVLRVTIQTEWDKSEEEFGLDVFMNDNTMEDEDDGLREETGEAESKRKTDKNKKGH